MKAGPPHMTTSLSYAVTWCSPKRSKLGDSTPDHARSPKPYRFIWFDDIHGPKPYKFIWFGDIHGLINSRFADIHGPEPYKFIWLGDIHGPKPQIPASSS